MWVQAHPPLPLHCHNAKLLAAYQEALAEEGSDNIEKFKPEEVKGVRNYCTLATHSHTGWWGHSFYSGLWCTEENHSMEYLSRDSAGAVSQHTILVTSSAWRLTQEWTNTSSITSEQIIKSWGYYIHLLHLFLRPLSYSLQDCVVLVRYLALVSWFWIVLQHWKRSTSNRLVLLQKSGRK